MCNKNFRTMIYGYVRVSTMKQCTDVQRYEIQKWCKLRGLEVDSWIDEKISGTKSIKIRQIRTVLEEMKAGDTLICTEISRLGRSMQVVFEIMKLCPQLLKRYLAFCKKHNLITESGKNYSSNAESVKRFILQDKEFKENHTGLEDTYIEYDILLKFLWYYEKHTNKCFYYKLDTTFNHFGLTRPDKYGNHLLKVC